MKRRSPSTGVHGLARGFVAVALLLGASPSIARPANAANNSDTSTATDTSNTTNDDWRIPPPRPAAVAARRTPSMAEPAATKTSLSNAITTTTTPTARPTTTLRPRRTTTTTAQPAPPPATVAAGATTIAPAIVAAIPRPVSPFGPVPQCRNPLATIDRWPLRARVAQLVMIGADGNDLLALTALVRNQQIGGFLIRSAPESASQLSDDLDSLAELAGPIPSFVAVDEEGGRVQPLRAVAGRLPSARRLSRLDPAAIREQVGTHSKELRDLGVTMVFGPVADVTRSTSGVIGDRAFGGDPLAVADNAIAYANGLLDGGLLPVVKHFPGHGSSSGDSHVGRVATPELADLDRIDIPPFRMVMAATPVAVMVGHLEVPGLSGDIPASVSPEAIEGTLRRTLGFRGLVITDSLSMGAVTGRWKAPGAAANAITAGADVALFVTISHRDAVGVIDALEQIVLDGRLTEAQLNRSVLRIVRSKGLDPCSVDPASLVAVRPPVAPKG